MPALLDEQVGVGTIVRVPLHGRRVRGWVVGRGGEPDTGRPLQSIAKVTGRGPTPELIDLAQWAAWRWAGSPVVFLRAASPDTAVRALPTPANRARPGSQDDRDGDQFAGGVPTPANRARPGSQDDRDGDQFAQGVLAEAASAWVPLTVRLPPAADWLPLVVAAAARGDALVLAPTRAQAAYLAARLRRSGHVVALMPDDWARAAVGGCVVVGARGAAWAPLPRVGSVVVLDEHDEAYQTERAPTWNARDVVMERARRAGAPCVLVSPCPSLESLATSRLVTVSRTAERSGWPVVEVVDRRAEAPGLGLYSGRLVALVRGAEPGKRVVCVLNRKGRVRLLACASCRELARCASCAAAVELTASSDGQRARAARQSGEQRARAARQSGEQRARAARQSGEQGARAARQSGEQGARAARQSGEELAHLACRRCGVTRPVVCLACGATRLKALRIGVSRASEDLELLAGQPVAEITGDRSPGPPPDAAVVVGTSAVLRRLVGARVVAFLDLDQELLVPRYRAAEEAMALVAQAARMVGPRENGGRIVVQTRLPRHEVIDAAVHADPSRLAVVESARRAALRFPPERALAMVSGDGAEAMIDTLSHVPGIEVMGPSAGRWLVRGRDHRVLCDALAASRVPKGGPRVAVDPPRV